MKMKVKQSWIRGQTCHGVCMRVQRCKRRSVREGRMMMNGRVRGGRGSRMQTRQDSEVMSRRGDVAECRSETFGRGREKLIEMEGKPAEDEVRG